MCQYVIIVIIINNNNIYILISYDIICDNNRLSNLSSKQCPATTCPSYWEWPLTPLWSASFGAFDPRVFSSPWDPTSQAVKLGWVSCIQISHSYHMLQQMPAAKCHGCLPELLHGFSSDGEITFAASQTLATTAPPTRESEKQMRRTRDASEHLEMAPQTSKQTAKPQGMGQFLKVLRPICTIMAIDQVANFDT